jgi:phage repressor protein C with HTH and peptisase S24 domain
MNDIFSSQAAPRLKKEREKLSLSQAEMAEICGISRETWGKYERGQMTPGGDVLISFAAAGADVQYVLTGTQSVNKHEKKQVAEQSETYLSKLNWQEYIEIPHFDVRVAAGHGAINTQEEQLRPLAFRTDWLKSRNLSTKDLVVVDVCGDSMEPYLEDGDLVLVDRSQVEIASGKTYVLQIDGHLLVKNLQLLPQGLVQVASFNQGFPPYQIDMANESLNMAVVGRVIASMHEW